MPNRLHEQSSPYLLQHAENPVHWWPWCHEAWETAKLENKLVIVSIGYATCHWCHVMERECFENETVAALMNRYFIAIKVDREERPDIDAIYMQAAQMMTGSGGWPLNCIALPDGKPIYAGTYFPKARWLQALERIQEIFTHEKATALNYAHEIYQGLTKINSPSPTAVAPFNGAALTACMQNWKTRFDLRQGGPDRAPKFILPNNYLWLLHYAHHSHDDEVMDHVHLTIKKIINGGIHDQLEGGFCRYSTDQDWHVPHFEKMLYDNAQILELLSQYYMLFPNSLAKDAIVQTIGWANNNLLAPNGGYYSAMDADSDGEEGKYYCLLPDEWAAMNEEHQLFLAKYYLIKDDFVWEHKWILQRNEMHELEYEDGKSEYAVTWPRVKAKLMAQRAAKIKPITDTKILTPWNALWCKGLFAAARALDEEVLQRDALRLLDQLVALGTDLPQLITTEGNGPEGFLDSYAFIISCCMAGYEATYKEAYIIHAKELAIAAMKKFYNPLNKDFYYSTGTDGNAIIRTSEMEDNVIPAASSAMLLALCELNNFIKINDLLAPHDCDIDTLVNASLSILSPSMVHYGAAYSNWLLLYLTQQTASKQVVANGSKALLVIAAEKKHYCFNTYFMATNPNSVLDAAKGKYDPDNHTLYRCENFTCKLPETIK